MERVDVGDEPERRLRAPGRDCGADAEPAERIDALGMENGLRPLRKDVVRVRVTRMNQRAVALRIPCLEAAAGCVDARCLCTDADPRVALALDLLLHLAVVG